MVRVRTKNKFPETITSRISNTNSSFHAKWRATAKVEFLFFKSFFLV